MTTPDAFALWLWEAHGHAGEPCQITGSSPTVCLLATTQAKDQPDA